MTKKCTTCKKELDISLFCKHSGRKDGLNYRCKACAKKTRDQWYKIPENREYMNQGHREWTRKNKKYAAEYSRNKTLIIKFGITEIQYQDLLFKQGGTCLICKKTCSSGRKLAVDHDHETGEIRGLLCGACNMGLGLFQDNPFLLENAKNYLDEFILARISVRTGEIAPVPNQKAVFGGRRRSVSNLPQKDFFPSEERIS